MKIPLLRSRHETEVDPVCHMEVLKKNPPGGSYDHEGTTYYFCGHGCNRAFQKEPDAYLSGDKRLEM